MVYFVPRVFEGLIYQFLGRNKFHQALFPIFLSTQFVDITILSYLLDICTPWLAENKELKRSRLALRARHGFFRFKQEIALEISLFHFRGGITVSLHCYFHENPICIPCEHCADRKLYISRLRHHKLAIFRENLQFPMQNASITTIAKVLASELPLTQTFTHIYPAQVLSSQQP